jgi:hypothetical protein
LVVSLPAAVLGVAIALVAAVGCEQGADAQRAMLAQHRSSWTREIAGLKELHAALAARLNERLGGARGGPAGTRARAVIDGARQSIVDVENELDQAATRIDQAIRHGGDSGEKALKEESARARGYLQGLHDQIGGGARQVDALALGGNGTKQARP